MKGKNDSNLVKNSALSKLKKEYINLNDLIDVELLNKNDIILLEQSLYQDPNSSDISAKSTQSTQSTQSMENGHGRTKESNKKRINTNKKNHTNNKKNYTNNKSNKTPWAQIFTLYGREIDDSLAILLDPSIRAVDKVNLAARYQNLYKILFNTVKPDNFNFSRHMYFESFITLPDILEKLKELNNKEDYTKLVEKKPDRYFHVELDCEVSFSIKFRSKIFSSKLFFESKLLTAPLDESTKLNVLKNLLSRKMLHKYLVKRSQDHYVLMTFSYMHDGMNISVPLSGDNDPELARIPSFWAAHLCFINKNIFSHFQANDGKFKPSRIAQHI